MPTQIKKARRAANAAKKISTLRIAENYLLRLFVAGATLRSRQAILRVREVCAVQLEDCVRLEVIDIYQQPRLARLNQIVATPTLIIELPRPVRRFIGSMTHITGLFVDLKLSSKVMLAP